MRRYPQRMSDRNGDRWRKDRAPSEGARDRESQMKWLTPEEEQLIRGVAGQARSFTVWDIPIARGLVTRGLLSEGRKLCSNCGMHDVMIVKLTDRGKIAHLISNVLRHQPNLLP